MSPKEKAKELIKRFKYWGDATIQSSRGGKYSPEKEVESATKCAIICVEEILEEAKGYDQPQRIDYWNKVLEILKAK